MSAVSKFGIENNYYWNNYAQSITARMGAFKKAAYKQWVKTANSKKANSLRDANIALKKLKAQFKVGDFNIVDVEDTDSLNRYAQRKAEAAIRLLANLRKSNTRTKIKALSVSASKHNIDLEKMLRKHGEKGTFARLCDEQFWRLRLRRECNKRAEFVARQLNFIAKQRDIYCSSFGFSNHTRRRGENRNLLEKMVAKNQYGDEFTLAELADKSVSNPDIQRAELMTRMAGFELLAQEQKHVGVFFTFTCPSKYHSAHSKTGARNAKYQNYTAREGQEYLNKVWARFRAKANREELSFYGFRIAEPHHDSTPHAHALLFFERSQVKQAVEYLRHYANQEDAHELYGESARKARFDVKYMKSNINKKTGRPYSATSYIAKYIAKNIDGFSLDTDLYNKPAETSAARIKAWASLNSIRQFQQVGGASVTAWRELRKLANAPELEKQYMNEVLKSAVEHIEQQLEEKPAQAWADYCKFAVKNELSVYKIIKSAQETVERICEKTGEIISTQILEPVKNKYGEIVKKIEGIFTNRTKQKTRFLEWKIDFKEKDDFKTALSAAWTCVNNCTRHEPQKKAIAGGYVYV